MFFSKESFEGGGTSILIMKKIILLIPLFLLAGSAKAVCPVCVVAVSSGIGLCRWLGVDDLISGVWIGGLTVSLIMWALNWIKNKKIDFKFPGLSVSIITYLIILLPLYFMGIIGHPANTFWGIDKLLFGTAAGSIVLVLSTWLHNFLKEKNGGKSYFPYQKVAVPVLCLTVMSLVFYYFAC